MLVCTSLTRPRIWWRAKILERSDAKTWALFKEQFYEQFLPSDFEKDKQKEWDWVTQKEEEFVSHYVDTFWAVLLKVTPFMTISEEEKMRKFEAGLQAPVRSLKVYPNSTINRTME